MLTDIYRIKTRNSVYEIQVNKAGDSRCHKVVTGGQAVDEPWRTVKNDSDYLEKLAIGPSFDVPGVVLTSMVEDYSHFVLSQEPKHTVTRPGGLLDGVVEQIVGQLHGVPRARRNKVECVGHRTTAQGREHKLLVDGHIRWMNEHESPADMVLLRASGCSLVP